MTMKSNKVNINMDTQLYSNLKHLTHIKVIDAIYQERYKYLPSTVKKWYSKAKPPRLFDGYYTINITDKWLKENHYTLDALNGIWSKPKLFMLFNDGKPPLEFIFDTFEKACEYRKKVFHSAPDDFIQLRNL